MSATWLISKALLRAWRRRPLRALAAAIGVILGATLATLVVSINERVSDASRSASGSEVVNANLVVQARSAGGFGADLAGRIRSASKGVPVTAVVQVNTRLAERSGDGARLSLLGVDRGARRFLPAGVTASVARRSLNFDAPALVVGETWLRRLGLEVGDRIRLEAARGTHPWTIAGALKGDLPNDGAIAVGSIEQVGFAFGRAGTVDTMYLQAPSGDSRDVLERRLQAVVGPAAAVGSLDLVGVSSARSLQAVQAMLLVAGFVGFLSAAVVVFVCWRLLLVDERASVARFRLTGAAPIQLIGGAGAVLFLATVVCCAIGLPLGVGAANLLHELTVQLVGFTGIAAEFDSSAHAAPLLAGAGAALLIATAAWVAGIRTFLSISPLEAIRPADPPPPSAGTSWWIPAVGAVALFLAAATAWLLPLQFGSLGVVFALLGTFLVAAGLILPLGRGLANRFPGFAFLAAGRQIAADSKRTLAIVLMVGLGVTAWLTLAAVASSYRQAIDRSVRSWTYADLFVRRGEPGQTLRDARFPPFIQRRLAGIPGVAQAGAFSFLPVDYRGRNLMVQAYDTQRVDGIADLIVYEGLRGSSMWRALEGGQIAVSQSMARIDGLKVGDTIVLPSMSGGRRLRIASVIDDYVSEGGTVVSSFRIFTQLTGERRIDDIPLVLVPGASPSVVAERVRRALSEYDSLTILDREKFRASITEFISSVALLFQGLAVLAFFIVLMAATLTLAASLSVRRRGLAVARLAGATPSQLRLQLCLETGVMAVAAWLLAVVATSLFTPNILNATAARTGLLPAVVTPTRELALALPLSVAVTMAATALVARMISREEIVETLRFE